MKWYNFRDKQPPYRHQILIRKDSFDSESITEISIWNPMNVFGAYCWCKDGTDSVHGLVTN